MHPWFGLCLLCTLLLLGPSSAEAEEDTTPRYGVVALQDHVGGLGVAVKRASREVTFVREGVELPLEPTVELLAHDAIRTAKGSVTVEDVARGLSLHLRPGGQLRLDEATVLRVGHLLVDTKTEHHVEVGEVLVTLGPGRAELRCTVGGDGSVVSREGRVHVVQGELNRTLDAGEGLVLVGGRLGEAFVPPAEELLAEDSTPKSAAPARSGRFHFRTGLGLRRIHATTWGGIAITPRVRLGGPLWLQLGAGLSLTPADTDPNRSVAFAIPIQVGLRVLVDLPRAFFVGGGGDLLVTVAEQCSDYTSCQLAFAADVGGAAVGTVGVLLGRRGGIDLDLGLGVARTELPPEPGNTEPVALLDIRLRLELGFFFAF